MPRFFCGASRPTLRTSVCPAPTPSRSRSALGPCRRRQRRSRDRGQPCGAGAEPERLGHQVGARAEGQIGSPGDQPLQQAARLRRSVPCPGRRCAR